MVCEAQPVIHSDEHNGFCHLPTLGEHPWVLPGQGRRVSDPKVHRVGLLRLLLRDTSLHCHTSDVITRDSGGRVTALLRGCRLAGPRVSSAGTAIAQRGRTGHVVAAEEEEGVGMSHTSKTNTIDEDPTAAGTGRGRRMASLSSVLPPRPEATWEKRTNSGLKTARERLSFGF